MSKIISRREFLRMGAATCAACATSVFAATGEDESRFVKEAMYYEKLDDLRIRCLLCPKKCEIADRERGACGVRENRKGTYYTLVHSRPCSGLRPDPIEKKPFYHVYPGSLSFSLATAGCNMVCRFCQNWEISQFRPEDRDSTYAPPETLADMAKRSGCKTIAYTYTEPVIFYEYMYDSAKVSRERGVGNVMISNGYINKAPMTELCKVLTAVKIDLKAFTEDFYVKMCGGHLKPVLDTLVTLKEQGIWFEIVVLLLPGMNDGEKEIREMCQWVRKELGPDAPIHFSRFYPTYMVQNLPRTPIQTVEQARSIALECGLNYAYIGNASGHEGEKTYCPKCKNMIVDRVGYHIGRVDIRDGKCANCGNPIPGVWA
ncbi:MAG: AmmeMemoRadiSam system radical SAM enzyme [Planctomycetota bacterium]